MSPRQAPPKRPARLAIFTRALASFQLVSGWAEGAGHEVVLVVSEPGPKGAEVAVAAPAVTLVLAPQVGSCLALIEQASVDLAVVCAFRRIPAPVLTTTRHGFVNVHPTLLPEYPGPNPLRALYDGQGRLGVTLHRVVEEIDAGPILSQAGFEPPVAVDPDAYRQLIAAATREVLEEGIPRALAGEPGTPQQQGTGALGRPFTELDEELGWDLPARLLEARATALLLSGRQPRALLDGSMQPIRRLRRLPGLRAEAPVSIHLGGRRALVGVADGVVEVDLGELPYRQG